MIALPLAITWTAAVALTAADGRRPAAWGSAVAALAASFAVAAWLAARTLLDGTIGVVTGGWPPGIGITLRLDPLGAIFLVLSLGLLLASVLYRIAQGETGRRFPALVLFLATGMSGLFLTGDAFNFYVFFEIAVASSFVIVADDAAGGRTLRETLVFIVLNLIGSSLLLLGVVGLYHTAGTLDMQGIAERLSARATPGTLSAGSLILAALSLKLGLFPFHTWLPPVYRTTTPAVSAILSGVLANIGSYGLLRFGGEMLPAATAMATPVLVTLGAASILYGGLAALGRRSVQDVLAYSAIGQVGFVLVAMATGGTAGYLAAFVYAIANAVDKTLLFLAAGARGRVAGAAFAVGALSLAGVPPSLGFLAKAAVFAAALTAGSPGVIVVLFLGSLLSFIYIFRTYVGHYWAEAEGPRVSPGAGALLLALGTVVVAVAVWPSPLLEAAGVAMALIGRGA